MSTSSPNPAVIAAQQAQVQIDECLDKKTSFRLEAGAGAGKTYSLVAALKRLIDQEGRRLLLSGKRIACITYTEVARNEIATEVEDHPAVVVNTIHAFSWAFMARFQDALRSLIESEAPEERLAKIKEGGGLDGKPIEYDLGFFAVKEDRVTLAHDDIPSFMAKLLGNPKFRLLFLNQFPVIFIDEYQDTDPKFMSAIEEYFFNTGEGPLIGLFGDHWQTIYRNEYQLTKYPIRGIDKGSNFRSVPAIVEVLNRLRPELPQAVRDPHAAGKATFFHANAYAGERTNDRSSKGDVLPDVARLVLEGLLEQLKAEGWEIANTKVLMLTHNVLAAEQGYSTIARVFAGHTDLFARKEDVAVKFFSEVVEPMCVAYIGSQYGEMFKILGSGPTIEAHVDKAAWRSDMDELLRLRTDGAIGDVLEHLKRTKRPSPPDRLLRRMEEFAVLNGGPVPEGATALERHSNLMAIPYKEVIELVKFVEKQTPFATQHSVKGAEFENVLVVLGGGWNHYNWPQLFELLETNGLNKKNEAGYYRARNLFYVSVSRPMVRLAVLATQTISDTGLAAVSRLFGPENVVALQFP